MNNIQKYQKKRDEMLLKCDPEALRKFVKDNSEYFTEDYIKRISEAPTEVLEIVLHKMIVNVTSLSPKRRRKSAEWLKARGFDLKVF